MPTYLTKSDFVAAQTCATKLYYRKHKYPRNDADNEFLQMLAEGGYLVGKLAQLLYPAGILITGSVEEAIAQTGELLGKHDNITLFEAAIAVNHQLVRVDVLIKGEDAFQIIEVKSKSFNSADMQRAQSKGKPYWTKKEYQPYLEDVAYQKVVLQEKYPDAEITTALMLPDTEKSIELEGVIGWFDVNTTISRLGHRNTSVSFTGTDEQLAVLRDDHVLVRIDVDQYVDPMLHNIRNQAQEYIESLLRDEPIHVPISTHCKDCEYRFKQNAPDLHGFADCWGDQATTSPHILDLGQLGNINKTSGGSRGRIDALILEGNSSILDVPETYLYSGSNPAYNGRPLYQRTMNAEFLRDDVHHSIRDLQYPLHFVDFETYATSIPPHAGMRPYEKVMFQWSCHSIESERAEPVHQGWLSTDGSYPNLAFARSLRDHIGHSGSVLTWSPYENTQLKTLRDLFKRENDTEMVQWLETIVNLQNGVRTRQLDMHELATKHYFHPAMGGRTSIKVTLPAVLQSTKSPRIRSWLQNDELLSLENDVIVDPYKLLPEPDVMVDGPSLVVSEGGGAMRAYQDMVYGIGRRDERIRTEYGNALIRYCRLDTLAMVVIWEHWMDLLFKRQAV